MKETRRTISINNRNYTFDNIKGILIILVVFGHILAGDGNSNLNIFGVTHYVIYAVHMPMFIFISGFFSKSNYSLKKFIKGVIIPYITFDILFNLFNFAGGGDYNFIIVIADNVYWYILCIGLMRVLNKYTKNSIIVVFISIAISAFYYFAPENIWRVLSLGRVFLMYPLFYIGVNIKEEYLSFINNKKILSVSIAILCVISELVLLYSGIVTTHWATHNQPTSIIDLLLKYFYMTVFTSGCFIGLLALTPNKVLPIISKCGRNSVMIYLIHMFFVKIIYKLIKVLGLDWNYPLFVIIIVVSVLLSTILASEWITRIYKWYITKISKLFRID